MCLPFCQYEPDEWHSPFLLISPNTTHRSVCLVDLSVDLDALADDSHSSCANKLNLNFRDHDFLLATFLHLLLLPNIVLDPPLSIKSTSSSVLGVFSSGCSPSVPKFSPLVCRATSSSSTSSQVLLFLGGVGLSTWSHLSGSYSPFVLQSYIHRPPSLEWWL